MEACHVKGGQGSCKSIPQIPVGELAYQNCSRDQLSRAEGGRATGLMCEIDSHFCEGGWRVRRPVIFGPPPPRSRPRLDARAGQRSGQLLHRLSQFDSSPTFHNSCVV
jgi:hypothetical protein